MPTTTMIFNRSNVFLLALGLLAVLSPHPTAAASRKAGGRRTRSEDAAERRRLLEEREEAFAEDNPYSVIDQDHRRAGSGSGGALFYSGSGTGSGTGKGKGSSKCGLPGERCCADPSHRCLPGYGCQFPVGMTIDEDDYTCKKCGDTNQPCCNTGCGEDSCESSCLPGNTCNLFENKCEGCGGPNQPCCPDDVCTTIGLACNTASGNCEECGDEDEVCCSGDKCSGTSAQVLTCNSDANRCDACGGRGQQCCPDDVCNSGTSDGDLACDTVTGTCETCGSTIDEICCPGNKCPNYSTERLSCNAATLPPSCQECGGPGQPCCPKADGYEFECDTKGKVDCIEGICPDATPGQGNDPAGCLLGNGSGPAKKFDPVKGCNQASTGNDALCCKGTCAQGPGETGNGEFMWCVK